LKLLEGFFESAVEVQGEADGLTEENRDLPFGLNGGFSRPVGIGFGMVPVVPDPVFEQLDQLLVERELGRAAMLVGVLVVVAVVVVMAHG
jgi:hypothetical protein